MVNGDPDRSQGSLKEFKKKARASQQEYCDLLGDRELDVIDKQEWTILRRKVGFGIYCPPSSTPTSDNQETGYNGEQLGITANTIIKEEQHKIINSHRQVLSEDAKKLFDKQTAELRGQDEIYGNAKVVKQLKRIENSKELYEMMADKNVTSNEVKLTEKGLTGLLVVNGNLKIHPLTLLSIPPEARQTIFEKTDSYRNGTLTMNQFHSEMKMYFNMYRIVFESMREETIQELCQMYGKDSIHDIDVGGKKVFVNIKPHEIDRLRVVLENTLQNDVDIMKMATEFARIRNCDNAKDFIIYTEYLVADLNETVKSYEASYQKDLAAAKKQSGFKQTQFDRSRGIGRDVKRKDFHKQKALTKFSNPEEYVKLNERFNTLKSKVAPLNRKCQPCFFSDDAATYHYLKHKQFGAAEQITPEEYFRIAEEIVGNPLNKTDSILGQDGSCVINMFTDSEKGVPGIKIDRNEGDSGIATVMYDKRLLRETSRGPNKI